MNKLSILILSTLLLTACGQRIDTMTDKSTNLCSNKPNCASTLEKREAFSVKPFVLVKPTNIEEIANIAKNLKGAKIISIDGNYAHIECTSSVFRFVDDLELRISGDDLIVRSESRVGYSDFGINKKRIEQLRAMLLKQGIIK